MASKKRLPPFVERHGAAGFRGWYIEVGKRERCPTRRCPHEAHRDAVRERARIDGGQASMVDRGDRATIGEMLKRMIGDAEQNHTAGYVRWWSEQGRSIEAIFKPGTLLAQIDREAIRAFIRLRGETVSPATLRHHRSALHRIFRVAISEGLHPGPNPVTSVQWPTVRKRPPRVIRWPILQGCIERVRYEQDSQNDVDLFEFVAMTGLRLSEIARVDIENIDLDAKSILIKGKRRDENVAIPSGTIAAVRRRVKKIESGPLFPGGINWVERRFKVWAKILKQPNWSCHVVGRHSLATHLARKGLPLQTIQRVMRHRSITTTQIYVHLANEDARSAVDGLDLSV